MTSRSGRFEILSDVMLSWTPSADPSDSDGGWADSSGAQWDLDGERTGTRRSWKLAVSHSREKRVGPGTVGWIHEWDRPRAPGGRDRLRQQPVLAAPESTNEVSWYADGVICVIPAEDRVTAETIMADPDWKPSAPYVGARGRQFKDGAPVAPGNAAVLRGLHRRRDRALARARRPGRRRAVSP